MHRTGRDIYKTIIIRIKIFGSFDAKPRWKKEEKKKEKEGGRRNILIQQRSGRRRKKE